MKKWKVVKSEDVSPSKWFPVTKQTVAIHNNQFIEDYYISPIGDGAMVLPFTENGEIVLIRQYKHGYKDITFDIPAGFIQKNKTIEASAVAELEEETGIRIAEDELTYLGKFSNVPSKLEHTTYSYLCTNAVFNSTQQLDDCEEISIHLTKPKSVLQMIEDNQIVKSDVVATISLAYMKFPELFE